jgi:tape measure domain-containing protein
MAERYGGRLLFATGLNNDELRAGAAQANNILRGIGDKAVAEGVRIDNAFKKVAAGIGSVFVFQQASQFVSQIARVRGEFQQLEVAFETMLQSKSKTDALMAQLVRTAAVTPFGLQDVAGGAKQLLAYGESAETVNNTLVRLGDIAAGLSIPLNDLVYLYGTTMVQGRLFTQDVRQFQGRGIPLIQELSKAFGKTTAEINEMVTAGKIGFPEVQKVIHGLTNEGGTFYNLMEKQSKTITGQISNLGDAFDTMLNKIGQSNEGVISSAISGATYLVENYEAIGKTILELVAVYGTYKAALITITALQKLNSMVLRQAAMEKKFALFWGKELTNAQAIAIARTKVLTMAQQGLAKAIKSVGAAMMKNPYALLAAAVIGLAYAVYKLATAENEAAKSNKRLNELSKEFEQSVASEQAQLDVLFGRLKAAKEGTEAYEKAKKDIMSKADSYRSGLSTEIDLLNDVAGAYKKISEAAIQSAKDRAIDKGTKDAADAYAESWADNIKKIRAKFLKEFGNLKGEELFQGLKETLENGGEFSKEIQDAISKFTKKHIESDFNTKTTSVYTSNDVDVYIKAINASKKVLDDEVSEINSIYGNLFKPDSGGGDAPNLKTFSEQVKAAKENIEKLKKELADLRSGATPAADYAKDIEEKQKELDDAQKKLDTLLNVDKKKLKALTGQEKLNDALLALRSKNIHNEIDLMKDGREKKLKEINADFEDQKANIEKQVRELAEANKKAAIKDKLNSKGLTDEQQAEIDKANKLNIENRIKLETDVYKSEIYAMRDYLKEYGTFQQQKLAIAEEYAEKIKNAQSEGERLLLEKQKQEAIGNIEINAIKAQIDWATVFGEFGGMFRDIIKPALDEAKKYVKTDEFKKSDQASQDALITAINQMEKSLGGAGTLNFKKLGKEVQAYQDSLRALNDAKMQEIDAINKLKKAQEDYEKAIKKGTEQEKKIAQTSLENAQSDADAASANVRAQTNIAKQNQQDVSDTASKLKASMENVTEGLSKLASGGLKSAYDGLIQAGKGMGGVIEKIADSLESVPIIGWILSILDVLKDGLSNLVGGLLDSIFNAVSGIIRDVFSGDIFVTILSSIRSGIGNILNAITLGGWDNFVNGYINGSNADYVAETTDRLTASNKVLTQSIDALKDEIGKARGLDTVKAYEEAVKKQKELIENTGDILAAQMGYHGDHHSNDYYINKSMSDSDWKRISERIGKEVRGTSDLWNLSPEDLKKVSTLSDIWEKIYNGGKYDRSSNIDQYLALAGTLEELEQGLRETLTQTTFDNVYDSFVETLMDMDASAEDFADNISEYFMRAMLSNQIGREYADKLNEWYKKFAESMRDDGTLSDAEREALKNEYMEYVNAAIKERDALASLIGYGSDESSRSASQKGFASMNQDSADELNGRFTAIQALAYNINENTRILVTNSGMILQHLSGIRDNTEFCRRLDGMDADLRAVKLGIDTINTKGVLIR